MSVGSKQVFKVSVFTITFSRIAKWSLRALLPLEVVSASAITRGRKGQASSCQTLRASTNNTKTAKLFSCRSKMKSPKLRGYPISFYIVGSIYIYICVCVCISS